MVNLKWHDAMAVAGWHFKTKEEHTAGWPRTMRPDQLAALQRPYVRGGIENRPGRWFTEALMKAIESGCASGELPNSATTLRQKQPANPLQRTRISLADISGNRFATNEWLARDFPQPAPAPTPTPKDVTVYQVTAPVFAEWLAAQGETPSQHIAAWIEASKSAHAVIEPPEGWTVISKYGTQLSPRHGKLVRLEDVFDWMHSSGVSAHDAVYKIFGPYYEACIEGENCDLLILNATERPSDLARDGEKSTLPNVKFFASAFPDLGHVKFEDGSFGGLVYSMGEAALRVWRGKADVSTDHYARFKDRKEAATDAKYGVQWPGDDALTKLLGRLAVPIKAAYRLWLYGRVVNATDDTAQGEAEARRDLRIVRDDQTAPTTWDELVSFRREHPATDWTKEQKGLLVAEFQGRGRSPGVKGVAMAMAKELGVTVTRFNDLKRTASQHGKRKITHQKAA